MSCSPSAKSLSDVLSCEVTEERQEVAEPSDRAVQLDGRGVASWATAASCAGGRWCAGGGRKAFSDEHAEKPWLQKK